MHAMTRGQASKGTPGPGDRHRETGVGKRGRSIRVSRRGRQAPRSRLEEPSRAQEAGGREESGRIGPERAQELLSLREASRSRLKEKIGSRRKAQESR